MKSCSLDFEFNRVTHKYVNLVSCVVYDLDTKHVKRFWLHNDPKAQEKLKNYLLQFNTILAYSAVAECRSFLALGLEPLDFEWIDLWLEWRMLTNHNDKMNFGPQYVDGRIKFIKKLPPKWERSEEEKETGFRHTHSLVECTYKLTGEKRDSKHKDKMRDLIIADLKNYSAKDREDILKYNEEDVVHLEHIYKRIKEEYRLGVSPNDPKSVDLIQYEKEAKLRGRYSAHTAWMETNGYCIDYEKTKNFSKQIPSIMYHLQKDINSQFEDTNSQFEDTKPFKWNKAESRFSWDQKLTREWIDDTHGLKKWPKTEKGAASLSLESFDKFYDYDHEYPRGNFGAQIVRFLKLKQSLYGFNDKTDGKRKVFWDYVGPDKVVRPFMNHYQAQSSRSQPAAGGFLFLKPAWMRALCIPEEGKYMGGIDYGSQEFFASLPLYLPDSILPIPL